MAACFGKVEFRVRVPNLLLDCQSYNLAVPLLLESLDSVAFKLAIPEDGGCIVTGKTAIYTGREAIFDDGAGHILTKGLPVAVCDKTASNLARFSAEDILITESTWHYNGGGCC